MFVIQEQLKTKPAATSLKSTLPIFMSSSFYVQMFLSVCLLEW